MLPQNASCRSEGFAVTCAATERQLQVRGVAVTCAATERQLQVRRDCDDLCCNRAPAAGQKGLQ